uniref:Tetraspanin n=1 Tax=Cyclopterus lumpus TaxID=8103 RepID=A0A8C2XK39_CYCLU
MCCSGFLKIMMFIFNGGIFLAGAGILGVGVWVKVDSGSLLVLLDNVEGTSEFSQLVNVAYVLIGVGAVRLVIGFLGCCGAVRESRCMLLTFIKPLKSVANKQWCPSQAEQLLDHVEDQVKTSIKDNYGSNEKFTSIWNATMEEFKCCGYKNYTDFDGSAFNNQLGGDLYPVTCCKETIGMIEGCFNKLLQLIEENAGIIGAVALGIAALEVAAMVVSMVLFKNIGEKA